MAAEVMLEIKEAAGLLQVTPRQLGQVIQAFRPMKTGNEYRIPLASLPVHAQNEYFAAQRQLVTNQSPGGRAEDGTNLTEIIEAEGEQIVSQALSREELVRQALDYDGDGVTAQREMLAKVAGVSTATLYRWISAYQERGFMGLLDGLRKTKATDDGGYGSRSFDQEAIEYGKELYLTRIKPKLSWIYERVLEKAEKEGWKVGSRPSFYRAMKQVVSYAEEVMGREGLEAYRKKVMPKVLRRRPRMANQIWVGDHHQLDFFVEYKGKLVRPWLTSWLDMASSAVMGWAMSLNPSSDTIALAFRHGMYPKADPENPLCGLPMEVYVDNGKDYRSQRLEATFSDLRIEAIFCEAYSPWAKPIERFHGTLADRYSRFAPAYIGNSPQNKPEDGYEKAKKLLKQGKLWTIEIAMKQFEHWLATDYHTRVHSGIKTTPYDAFRTLPKARLDIPNERAGDVCLMRADTRKVFDEGVRFHNFWYASDELWRLVGETVTVYYDPYRLGELVLYHKGSFACVVRNRELLEMGASQDDLKEFLKRRRHEMKELERRVRKGEQTLEQVVAERRQAGPVAMTPASKPGKSKVTTLTGHEEAGRELAKNRAKNSKAGKRAKRDLADEYIKALAEG